MSIMSANVTFSYENDTIVGFHVTVNGIPMHMRIEAINNNVAKIYATDVQGNPQPMPPSISLSDAAGANVVPYNDEFLVTWIDSYILKVSGVDAIWMTNQKQQAFKTAPGITHFEV
ncbi:hypothetical protein TSOC_000507 [Tetrabaena socialis]|uniref:Uncharacterized protein n=1 Tax=Tetrabaena socialis TaxID=47790 RepID=A0A2J8AJ46_9CHLO|nr:hypothetical protein TSOC_000507 [Tetrabaena socialis]|eukprot:PNH12534.1 hypothetical protein TSOC_000507 [Tetrabaena socialis]